MILHFKRQSIQEEFEKYVDSPQIATGLNPLEWWAVNEKEFPRISVLAKAYLAIPATSVPCEQSFSKAGFITENRHSRCSTKHVRKCCFYTTIVVNLLNKNC